MSEAAIQIKLKINFPVIMIAVLFIHALVITTNNLRMERFAEASSMKKQINPITIRQIKTRGVENAVVKTSEAILDAGGTKTKTQPLKQPVSFKDLAFGGGGQPQVQPQIKRDGTTIQQRPGTRPVVAAKSAQAMNKISLKSQEFRDYSKSFPSGGLAISDMISSAQKISDAVVSIEVPEGIEQDQLNEYELMFYGFQKRTAMNYVNSILKNLDSFQRKHPHYKIPTSGRITMTARLTYDSQGNVQQIKMIRWTHVDELQGLFEDIVKNIDQLHNPPKQLWEKQGEFSMFYTLEIVNG